MLKKKRLDLSYREAQKSINTRPWTCCLLCQETGEPLPISFYAHCVNYSFLLYVWEYRHLRVTANWRPLLRLNFIPSSHNQREWNILSSTFHTDLKFRLLACFVANPCVHRPSPSLVCPVTLQLNSEEHLPLYKPFSPVHIPEKHSKRCFRLTITFWALLLVNGFTLLFTLHVVSVRMAIYPSRQAFNCASATR